MPLQSFVGHKRVRHHPKAGVRPVFITLPLPTPREVPRRIAFPIALYLDRETEESAVHPVAKMFERRPQNNNTNVQGPLRTGRGFQGAFRIAFFPDALWRSACSGLRIQKLVVRGLYDQHSDPGGDPCPQQPVRTYVCFLWFLVADAGTAGFVDGAGAGGAAATQTSYYPDSHGASDLISLGRHAASPTEQVSHQGVGFGDGWAKRISYAPKEPSWIPNKVQ